MKRLIFALAALLPTAGHALDVSSPYVKEGILELESKNRFDEDDRNSEDGFRRHFLSAAYGINRWWAFELAGEFDRTPQQGYGGLTLLSIENTFQFTKRGEYWLDSGLKVSYGVAGESAEPDELDLRLILVRNQGRFRHTANLGWAQEIGPSSNANPTGELRFATRYNAGKWVNPGLEYYAAFNEYSDMQGWDDQRHRIGPALYGKLADGVSYETGVAFGLSRRAEDAVFKLNLKYEFGL
jgi:hypothetical protein